MCHDCTHSSSKSELYLNIIALGKTATSAACTRPMTNQRSLWALNQLGRGRVGPCTASVGVIVLCASGLHGADLQEATLKPALEEQRRIRAKHGNKLDMEVLSEMEVRDETAELCMRFFASELPQPPA